jgi:hypothetical protein
LIATGVEPVGTAAAALFRLRFVPGLQTPIQRSLDGGRWPLARVREEREAGGTDVAVESKWWRS